jgi:hypothetical protein
MVEDMDKDMDEEVIDKDMDEEVINKDMDEEVIDKDMDEEGINEGMNEGMNEEMNKNNENNKLKLNGNELEFTNKLDKKNRKLNDDIEDDIEGDIEDGIKNKLGGGNSIEDFNINVKDIDIDMYPEVMLENNYNNEPGDKLEDEEDEEEDEDLVDMIEDKLNNKKNKSLISKTFIQDLLSYLVDLQKIIKNMNKKNVDEEISKGRNSIIKENLRINRDLSAEGMEDTRKMVNNLKLLGRLDYTNMTQNYDDIMNGSEEDNESNELVNGFDIPKKIMDINNNEDRDLFAKDDVYGNDNGFYEENIFIGESEDMEGGDMDYGYLGID